MANNKNTIQSDEDEERDRNDRSSGRGHPEISEERGAVLSPEKRRAACRMLKDVDEFAFQRPLLPLPSLDEVLSDYIFPTPYLDEKERMREEVAREASQQHVEGFSEYEILDSDDSGEEEDEDRAINDMLRPNLASDMQQPQISSDKTQHEASESGTVLAAELKAKQDCIWEYFYGSAYRKDKIQAYRNEGLSPEGAASQADVMFRMRVLSVIEGRGTPGNPEIVAFLQEFPLGTLDESCELCRVFARNPEEEEELEPLIPKETADKVWEAWCVALDLTSDQVADLFKDIPDSEELVAYTRYEERWSDWLEKLATIGLPEAEASEKLTTLCKWAKHKHNTETESGDVPSQASSSTYSFV